MRRIKEVSLRSLGRGMRKIDPPLTHYKSTFNILEKSHDCLVIIHHYLVVIHHCLVIVVLSCRAQWMFIEAVQYTLEAIGVAIRAPYKAAIHITYVHVQVHVHVHVQIQVHVQVRIRPDLSSTFEVARSLCTLG